MKNFNITNFKGGKNLISIRLVVAILSLVALAPLCGCSIIENKPALTQYVLVPNVPNIPLYEKALPVQMLIGMPDSGGDLDTDRIALVFDGREVRYLAGVKWDNNIQRIIQRLIIQYFTAGNCFAGIGTNSSGIVADYRLITYIDRLHLVYKDAASAPTAEIRLSISVLRLNGGQVIGQTQIVNTQLATGTSIKDLLTSLDTVTTKALVDTTEWATKTVATDLEQDTDRDTDKKSDKDMDRKTEKKVKKKNRK